MTVFAIAGALAGAIPLPVVPRRLLRAVRGALAHDVCSRHGLALTAEARSTFAEPGSAKNRSPYTKDALAFIAARALARVGPYATAVAPLRSAVETVAFGRLLDRYLERHRPTTGRGRVVRIDGEEATAIRAVIDRAIARAIKPGLQADAEPAAEPPEDYRGGFEKAVDGVLVAAARLPEWIAARLDAALDRTVAGETGAGHP